MKQTVPALDPHQITRTKKNSLKYHCIPLKTVWLFPTHVRSKI